MRNHSNEPSIAIVVINFNGFEITAGCVRSIENSDYVNWHIFLIDNASTDDSGRRLLDAYQQNENITVILSSNNSGTSGANNLGLKKAFKLGFDYVLLLNNDTELLVDSLRNLIGDADETLVRVPLITYAANPNLAWYAGGFFDRFMNSRHYGMKEEVERLGKQKQLVEYAPTCCFLIPQQVYNAVGGFDEDYFMYWEDVDYCIKLKRNNIDIEYDPSSEIRHKVSLSSGGEGNPRTYYYCIRNRLYGVDKLQLGIRPWLWARLSLLKSFLLRNNENQFGFKAWKDYKSHNLGYADLGK